MSSAPTNNQKYPSASNELSAEPKRPLLPQGRATFLKELWWFLGARRWKYLGHLCLIFICAGSTLVPPYFLGKILEALALANTEGGNAAASSIERRILTLSILMSILVAILHVCRVHFKRITADIRSAISADSRQQAIDLFLAEGLRDGRLIGNEVSRLDTGLRDFADLHRMFQNEVVFCCITFFGCAFIFVTQAPLLLLTTVSYLFIFIFILRWSIPKVQAAQTNVSLARESFSGVFANVVGNALSVQASGAEESMGKKVGSSVNELELSEQERNLVTSRQWSALNLLNTVYLGMTLAQAGLAGLSGTLTIALVVVTYSYARELIRSVVGLMDVAEGFVQSYVGFRRLLHLLGSGEEIFTRDKIFPETWKYIELSHVTHRYQGVDRDVLQKVNLKIQKGSCIAIRGNSGAGKSTLIKILLGLLKPNSGLVMVDGVDLQTITPKSLRRNLAVALQECEILGLSLRENITLCRDVDETLLTQAVSASGLDAVISRLPQGLETMVGERGYRLSGGERQRVALARAIVRRPSLLVIDEATSMLDSKTEERFFAELKNLLPDLTLVIISHHERDWALAETIFELNQGQLAIPG